MAYLNGNATCFRPSLTIEQIEGGAPERATEVLEYEYSLGFWDTWDEGDKFYFFLYSEDIPEETEIKTVDVKFNGGWVNLTEYAVQNKAFELANKKLEYDVDIAGYVFAGVYFPSVIGNELINAIRNTVLESIRITYYIE